jgi:hypothetical protein
MTVTRVVNLTEEQYKRVTEYLAQPKATKKAACEMLGISYNTKKLAELIERFEQRETAAKAARLAKRKTAVTLPEVAMWVTAYLNGESPSEIADGAYRSESVVKLHLEKHGAMLRRVGKVDRLNPPMLPEQCMSDDFEVGQYVWVAAYNCVGVVKGFYKNAVKVWVLSEGIQEHSYQAPWELGSLKHLEAIGVRLEAFTHYMKGDEVRSTLVETMIAANKRTKAAD